MKTAEQIVSMLDARIAERGPLHARLVEVRDAYNADLCLDLPELDQNERLAVPNLVLIGVDGAAERMASIMPNPWFPDDDGDNRTARRLARERTDVVRSWWHQSHLDLRMYRRARYYSAYGRYAAFIRPSAKHEAPTYELRDPLTSYPSDEPDESLSTANVIFTFKRSASWAGENYPKAEASLKSMLGDGYYGARLELIEYVDDDEWVLIARVDPEPQYAQTLGHYGTRKREIIELERLPNRINRCPAVLGGKFGLSRTVGQFDSLIGILITQARLQALETIAVTKDVFPNTWEIGQDGQNPQIVIEADGMRGVRGQMRNGTIFVENSSPGYMTPTTIDRLERNARVGARIPAEFGGEASTNVRTGARGGQIISATVDFQVQEAQRLFARSLTRENEIAIAVDKAYFGPQRKTIWVGSKDQRRKASYVPDELWTTDRHDVDYTHAGSDANSLTIGLLQLQGANVISAETVRRRHPLVDNPEQEHDYIQAEQLEAALLSSVAAQANQGAIPPSDLARIMQLVKRDELELADAIMKAQEEAQARQAAQVPATDPAAQPGLAQPGMGAESAPIPEVQPGLRNLQSLAGATRLINMRTPNEMAPVGNVSAAG